MDRTQLPSSKEARRAPPHEFSSMRRKGIWGTLQSAPQMSFPEVHIARIVQTHAGTVSTAPRGLKAGPI